MYTCFRNAFVRRGECDPEFVIPPVSCQSSGLRVEIEILKEGS